MCINVYKFFCIYFVVPFNDCKAQIVVIISTIISSSNNC